MIFPLWKMSAIGGGSLPEFPLFIFNAESNSGGIAVNADLSAPELASRPAVKILNNTTLAFQDLDIGTNNIISHAGLTNNATHGLEAGLAKLVEAGRLTYSTVYLLKTGQGGDVISSWSVGNASGYWSTFLTRYAAVQSQASLLGIRLVPAMFYTQGINDEIGFSLSSNSALSGDAWKAATVAHFAKMRSLISPTMPIFMTSFQAPLTVRPDVNAKMIEIAAVDPYTFVLDTAVNGTRIDENHWSSVNFRHIAERFVDAYIGGAALAAPTVTPDGATFATTQDVTITGPAGASIRYTTDGSDPTWDSTLYTGTFTLSTSTTIKAISTQTNAKNSVIETSAFTLDAGEPVTWDPADAAGHFNLTNNNLEIARAISSSAYRSVRTSTSKTTGKHYLEIKCTVAGSTSFLLVGFCNAAMSAAGFVGGSASSVGSGSGGKQSAGSFTGGTTTALPGGPASTDDIYQLAVDMDAGKLWIGYNNTWLGSGDPVAGTNQYANFVAGTVGPLFGALSMFSQSGVDGTWELHAKTANLTYSPPSGYSAWAGV